MQVHTRYRPRMASKLCKACSKPFEYQLDAKHKDSCLACLRPTHVRLTCHYCGKRFSRLRSQLKNYRSVFCSPECSHASKHKETLAERIAKKLLPRGDCQIWLGNRRGKPGYERPYIMYHGKYVAVQRWQYAEFYGSIDPDRNLLVSCGDKRCCKPTHLYQLAEGVAP